MLDDFTEENGATAVRPGTQVRAVYPEDGEEFKKHMRQPRGMIGGFLKGFCFNLLSFKGKAGDVMFFTGLLQHCAMPNRAKEGSRTGLIIQFLPKFVRPMEDLRASIDPKKVDAFPEVLKLISIRN